LSPIVDTLYVDQEELADIVAKYSSCSLNIQKNFAGFQRYQLTIPDETVEKYFSFLIEKELERASVNFLKRSRTDDAFHRWVMSHRRGGLWLGEGTTTHVTTGEGEAAPAGEPVSPATPWR
jgi:hypothetical protein